MVKKQEFPPNCHRGKRFYLDDDGIIDSAQDSINATLNKTDHNSICDTKGVRVPSIDDTVARLHPAQFYAIRYHDEATWITTSTYLSHITAMK